MPLVLVYLALAFGVIVSYQMTTISKNKSIDLLAGGYSPATTSLVKPYQVNYNGVDAVDDTRMMARNTDTAVVRVCRQLSYEMKVAFISGNAACSTYRDSTVLYSFIGTAGASGSIDSVYSGTTSSTLNCASPADYGRYIFTRALPNKLVTGKGLMYNLSSVVSGKYDPCGFREIVY